MATLNFSASPCAIGAIRRCKPSARTIRLYHLRQSLGPNAKFDHPRRCKIKEITVSFYDCDLQKFAMGAIGATLRFEVGAT